MNTTMEQVTARTEIIAFVNKVRNAFKKNRKFNGVYYIPLDSKYCLVMASGISDDDSAKPTLFGKVAYNCDDLQCDYDYDWYMPYLNNNPNDEIYDTEIIGCEEYAFSENLVDEFIEILGNVNIYAHIPA